MKRLGFAPEVKHEPGGMETFLRSIVVVSLSGSRWIRLRLGTLDSDPETTPAAHVFVSFKAPWTVISDDLPQRG